MLWHSLPSKVLLSLSLPVFYQWLKTWLSYVCFFLNFYYFLFSLIFCCFALQFAFIAYIFFNAFILLMFYIDLFFSFYFFTFLYCHGGEIMEPQGIHGGINGSLPPFAMIFHEMRALRCHPTPFLYLFLFLKL